MEVNATSLEMATFDTRTPPKVKQQQKMKVGKPMEVENSHAGVAIPVDEDSLDMEETTKKLNFYKVERPTTNSGLSTWILLSGQGATPTKPPKKTVIKPTVAEKKPEEPPKQNVTLVLTENMSRNPKPIFKKRVTTPKPASAVNKTVAPTTTTPKPTTAKVDLKLTKVKATVLNTAVLKKTTATSNATDTKVVKKQTATTQNPTTLSTTTKILLPIIKPNASMNAIVDSNKLPMEGKEGDTDLQTSTDSSKKKKTTTKRKKNKTRRRKPSSGLEKSDDSNSTKIDKHKAKEKPIGTQLYNYLSREVMPTVGVGLVGLMVTAGLASYFLYPFGVARRSYEIDRKDKEGPPFYYDDEYSGGIAEEEAIGKVIAGMPATSYYSNNVYKTSTSRNTYPNMRYRNVDVRRSDNSNMVRGTVESVPLTPEDVSHQQGFKDSYLQAAENQPDSNFYQPQAFKSDEVQEKKFVVGNIPKDVITSDPQSVDIPEHGPRSLKIRKRRSTTDNETENELNSKFTESGETNATTTPLATSTESITTTMESLPDKYVSFFNVIKDLLHLKIRMGLQIIQNATQSISKYVSKVQTRLDEQYKNETEGRQ